MSNAGSAASHRTAGPGRRFGPCVRCIGRYELGGESVIIVRQTDGAVRALYNVCRHRGMRLVRTEDIEDIGAGAVCGPPRARSSVLKAGKTGRAHFRCPYHGWTYGPCPLLPIVAGLHTPREPSVPRFSALRLSPLHDKCAGDRHIPECQRACESIERSWLYVPAKRRCGATGDGRHMGPVSTQYTSPRRP